MDSSFGKLKGKVFNYIGQQSLTPEDTPFDQHQNQTSMTEDPVFRAGVAGGMILLTIHFGICLYILFQSLFCGAKDECDSLFSDESIEYHRKHFEEEEEMQRRSASTSSGGSSIALETLDEIKAENEQEPLSMKETIQLLHARLKQKGALPNRSDGYKEL